MKKKFKGEFLSKLELKEISENFILTKHAKKRLSERFPKNADIKNSILNPVLAYWNTDGSINIAVSDFEYFVIIIKRDRFIIVTFKEKSNNDISIYEKRKMALVGHPRKAI